MRLSTSLLSAACLISQTAAAAIECAASVSSAISTPTAIPDVISLLSGVNAAAPAATDLSAPSELASNYLNIGIDYTKFIPPETVLDTPSPGVDSYNNTNPINPNPPIYPKKSPSDAPYSLPESALRGAIYIPDTFTYGNTSRLPTILVLGTGVYGSTYFYYTNFQNYLYETSLLDPVWLNIPYHLWYDAQVNAEYVAYAINYISAISHHTPVVVIPWSQGNMDAQWAYKYWPSTRSVVSDQIALSPGLPRDDRGDRRRAGDPCPAPPSPSRATAAISSPPSAPTVAIAPTCPTTTVYSGTDRRAAAGHRRLGLPPRRPRRRRQQQLPAGRLPRRARREYRHARGRRVQPYHIRAGRGCRDASGAGRGE